MQKARRHCQKGSSDRLQAQGFRISFTLLVEVLFTFPSQYSSTIGLTGVFSLAGWSRRIRAGFLVSRATQDAAMPAQASGTGLSPPAAPLPLAIAVQHRGPTTPGVRRHTPGLGSSPVARRYWGNHWIIFFSSGY